MQIEKFVNDFLLSDLEKQQQKETRKQNEIREVRENPYISIVSPNLYLVEGKSIWSVDGAINDAKKKATNFCNKKGKAFV